MIDQFNQAVTTYNSMNGIRGMGKLVNNPLIRRYLPNDWSQAMTLLDSPGGYTGLASKIQNIKNASQLVSVADTGLSLTSKAAKLMEGQQNQAATNRALSEEGYKQASDRIADIQTLIDKVDAAPDAKDIADLQARIQGEQAMIANEMVKLQGMAQLQQAQRDLMTQQAREISMMSTKSATGIVRF
jgi:type IV secretion system protein VirB5